MKAFNKVILVVAMAIVFVPSVYASTVSLFEVQGTVYGQWTSSTQKQYAALYLTYSGRTNTIIFDVPDSVPISLADARDLAMLKQAIKVSPPYYRVQLVCSVGVSPWDGTSIGHFYLMERDGKQCDIIRIVMRDRYTGQWVTIERGPYSFSRPEFPRFLVTPTVSLPTK
jgi:hypothetical protein